MSMVEQSMLLEIFTCFAKNEGTHGDKINIFIFPLD